MWRNDVGGTQPMRTRQFQLAGEALRDVSRLYVLRALVFVKQGNWAIHERALLALSIGGLQAEAVGVSDPNTAGGQLQWSTCTCVLPATGDLGVGSFAFIYGPPTGRTLVAEGVGLDLSGVGISFDFPLYNGLADGEILQCVLELQAE